MPSPIQLVASLIPLTFGLDGIRRVVIEGARLGDVWVNVVVLIVFIVILLPLSKFALDFMENLGKKEGRLTLRWQ
jgi:ABC-2 type transport system permease protein